jgi:hypothetical protein
VVARKRRLLQQTPSDWNASSSKVTDVIKDKVTKAFQRGSTAATDAFQNKKLNAIHVVGVTSYSIRGKVQKVSNAVSNAASDGFVRAVSHHVQSATKTASDTSYRAVSKTAEAIKASSKAAVTDASERIRNTTFAGFWKCT